MFHNNWLISKKMSRANNFILAHCWLHIIQNILPEIQLLLGKGDISSDESLYNSWPSYYSCWLFCSTGNGGKCSEHWKRTEFKDKYAAALQESYENNFLTGWIKFFWQMKISLVNCCSFQWGKRMEYEHIQTSYILLTQAKGLTELTEDKVQHTE